MAQVLKRQRVAMKPTAPSAAAVRAAEPEVRPSAPAALTGRERRTRNAEPGSTLMRRSLTAAALLFSGALLAGCQDNSIFVGDSNLRCDQVHSYSVGNTTNGNLSTSDCTANDGSSVDYYRFRLSDYRTVQVDMTSFDLDPYVVILDENGDLVRDETDGGQGYSRVEANLSPGTYYIAASSYQSQELGSYQLTSDYF
jgi:hypothetical protein